jgi:O-antigen/teichoic acid export membrane protein
MVFQIGRQLLSLGSILVLARRISPSAFGLMSMATVVINFIDVFRDLGTGNAIVRAKDLSDRLLSSLYWLNLGFGLLLAAMVIGVSAPCASFFRQAALARILQVLAVVFLLPSLSVVPTALLTRQMAFRPLSIIQLVGAVSGTIAAITAAIMGAGVWSLVLASLVSNLVNTVGLWTICSWRPQFLFDTAEIRAIASYSLHLSGFNFLNYFSRNADNLIVGRFLGDVSLGYYQMAYTLMTYPLSNFSSVIAGVMFPAFCSLQEDNARLRSAFNRAAMLVGLATIPAMLGLAVVAGPFVNVVLGERWKPVSGLLLVFAPLGMLQSIYTMVGSIYNAKGRTDRLFQWGLFSSVLYVGSFFLGLHWGIQGVATSYAIVWLTLMIPGFSIPFRIVQLQWREFLVFMWPEVLLSLAMALVTLIWLRGIRLIPGTGDKIQLGSTVVIGIVFYVGALLWWKPPVLQEMRIALESSGHTRLARLLL